MARPLNSVDFVSLATAPNIFHHLWKEERTFGRLYEFFHRRETKCLMVDLDRSNERQLARLTMDRTGVRESAPKGSTGTRRGPCAMDQVVRVAYLLYWELRSRDGVVKKVESQTNAWRRQGFHAQAFCLSTRKPETHFDGRVYRTDRLRYRLLPNLRLIRDIKEFNPDILYVRYHLPDTSLLYLMWRYRCVVELNSDDIRELRGAMQGSSSVRETARYWLHLLLRWWVFILCSGIVCPTQELSRRWHVLVFRRPCRVVPNSLDIERIRYRKQSRDLASTRPRLFFLGSAGQSWHGVDLLEKLAAWLGTDVEVDVIGQTKDTGPANVRYHGFLDESEYRPILRTAHVAVGSLALFRNGMREACPIKVREYLAAGYPVIIGYEDTAFAGRDLPPWVCRIRFGRDGSLSEAELSRVRRFLKEFAGYVVGREVVRSLIDSPVVEARRVAFLRTVAKRPA